MTRVPTRTTAPDAPRFDTPGREPPPAFMRLRDGLPGIRKAAAGLLCRADARYRAEAGELAHLDTTTILKELCRQSGMGHLDDGAVARAAVSNEAHVAGQALENAVGQSIIDGFRDGPDTTRGWTLNVPVETFKEQETYLLESGTRLDRHGRGATATHADLTLTATRWSIARYAKALVLDEQDLIDDRHVGMFLVAARQLGMAGRRVRADLVWSLILGNPTLSDDVQLFHEDHGNLGTDPLDADALGDALGAIAGQVHRDREGRAIHLNRCGEYLVVPPALEGTARGILRDLRGEDIELLVESRIGPAGLVDPELGGVVEGSNTNWYLFAPSTVTPTAIVGTLDGNEAPSVRSSPLTQGQWGIHFDVLLDIGAAVLDHRGSYYSTGAGGD